MYLVVIDTNVLISAAFKKGSNPFKVLEAVSLDKISLACTKEVFEEYKRVFSYKKFEKIIPIEKKETILNLISEKSLFVIPRFTFDAIKDKDDNKFLECAVEARADFIVTGNTRDFVMDEFMNVKIVTPSEFIEYLE